jgi:predicted phage-related endonuclease
MGILVIYFIFMQDYLAGYDEVKREIEDTVLLALTHPDVYDKITKHTRIKQESNQYLHFLV